MEQRQCLGELCLRLAEPPGLGQGDAQRVAAVGQAQGQAHPVVYGDALFGQLDRAGQPAQLHVDPGEVAQGAGLADVVAVGPEVLDGLQQVALAVGVAGLVEGDDPAVVGRPAAGERVAGLAGEVHGLASLVVGLVEAAGDQVDVGEGGAGAALGVSVPDLQGCVA